MEDQEKISIASEVKPDAATASIIRLRNKRRRALDITRQHTVANMLLAGTPIPFSDGPFLAVSEGVLVARIMLVYDMDRSLGALTGLFGTIGGTLLSSVATMTAANLIKCIPGAGTVVGGSINAGVAAAFTLALGLLTIGACEYVQIQAAKGEESDIEAFLKSFDRELEDALRRAYNQASKKPISPYADYREEWG